jgi:hypothetical protein
VFPNPSVGSPWVRFTAPEGSDVVLDLYDVSGRRVARQGPFWRAAGTYYEPLSLSTGRGRLPAGVYFVEVTAGRRSSRTRLVLTAHSR